MTEHTDDVGGWLASTDAPAMTDYANFAAKHRKLLDAEEHILALEEQIATLRAEGAALVSAVQQLKEALARMDTCDKGYDELLATHKWTDAELAETGANCEFFRGDVIDAARAVVARLAGGPHP